jgi:DNA invertase Pin-like site-specific DNA recombinase
MQKFGVSSANEQAGLKKPPRVNVYKRKSRLPDGQVDYSMEFQEGEAEEYIQKHGWQHIATYDDPDKTGRNGRRAGLKRLQRDIIAGRIDIVLVYRLDRLFRNLLGFLKMIQLMTEHNVELVSVKESFDTRSPWGRLFMFFMAGFAEIFVWQVSENTRRALSARARKGLHNGSIPVGYCKGLCSHCMDPNGEGYCPNYGDADIGDGIVMVPHLVDNHVVKRIFEWTANERKTNRQIAEELNAHPFPLPEPNGDLEVHPRPRGSLGKEKAAQKGPRYYSKEAIRDILGNVTYLGLTKESSRPPLDMRDGLENSSKLAGYTKNKINRRQ